VVEGLPGVAAIAELKKTARPDRPELAVLW